MNPCSFLVDGMFIAPWGIALSFDFCYDLDLCSQGQAVRAIFIRMVFYPNFVKIIRGILVKHVRKLHSQVAHDMIIVGLLLTYFHINCVVLKP